MLASQRHDIILDMVRSQGSVRVRELAAQLHVSDMTIRRDLDALAGRHLIEKVHGGATIVGNQTTFEPGFEAKRMRQQDEKKRIAAGAAELVTPGASIGITAGTTTWELAPLLTGVHDLTIVTNAPTTAQSFYQSGQGHQMAGGGQTIVSTGGIRTPSDALVGPLATAALSQLHLDVLFMGVHGIDPDAGYTTPNLAEAEVNAAFVRAAEQVIVMADHTKWRLRGLARIASLDEADMVITDDQLPSSAVQAFNDADVELKLV